MKNKQYIKEEKTDIVKNKSTATLLKRNKSDLFSEPSYLNNYSGSQSISTSNSSSMLKPLKSLNHKRSLSRITLNQSHTKDNYIHSLIPKLPSLFSDNEELRILKPNDFIDHIKLPVIMKR